MNKIAKWKKELSQQQKALAQHMKKWDKASDDYQNKRISWDKYNAIDNVRCDIEQEIRLLNDLIKG